MKQVVANQLIKYAEEKAQAMSVPVCIAITDSGAHLKAFTHMDNAFKGSIDVAIRKAKTSSLFPLSSGDFGDLIREQSLTGMEQSNDGLIAFAGGLPITINNEQIGAIGISGGSAEQDEEIATFAISKTLSSID